MTTLSGWNTEVHTSEELTQMMISATLVLGLIRATPDRDMNSSEIRVLCLMKCSSGRIQNLPYFWNKKIYILVIFVSCYLMFAPY